MSGELKELNSLQLELDPKNPRLTAEEEGSSQSDLLKIMIERFKVEELAESIIAAGFLPFDPLIGWEHDGVVTILEGNRRLAAIKLLLRPELTPKQYRKKWQELSKRLRTKYKKGMSTVQVKVYSNRDEVDLTAYIGFRHVTGVLQWPALEKAKFIAMLIEEHNWSYEEVAERLGSYSRHVERHYVAHNIVRQARDEEIAGSESVEDAFGVLMRALQTPGVTDFLGVKYPGDPKKSRSPIQRSRVDRLKEFVEWTFGTAEKERILPDSRQLTQWGRILQSSEALSYLRRTPNPDFNRAWFRSGGQAESLADSLMAAADRLQEAVPLVSEHSEAGDVKSGVKECTRFLIQILRYFPDVGALYGIKF